MKAAAFGGIVRAVLAGVGGYLVAQGYIDQGTSDELIGAGVVIAVSIWSIWNKKKLIGD